MISPDLLQDGRDDHDYHRPRAEEEDSTDAFDLPGRRRLNHSHENTDHDYVAPPDDDEADVDAELEAAAEALFHGAGDEDEPAAAPLEQNQNEQPPAVVAAATSSAANNDVINLTSPSPPKKRKRLSMHTPKSGTPKAKAASADDGEEEDDGLTCPICLDSWEMSGEHRLVSLKCGHLFGNSCIRRWLQESARQSGIKACPQCKSKAVLKDIRCLYAKRLRAIDRSEEHHLREQLDQERGRASNLMTELATLKMSHTMITTKIQTLEADNERMKQLLRSGGGGGGAGIYSFDGDAKAQLRLPNYKLFMERNIEISKEPGCRVMIYAEKKSTMIVSQKSTQHLFPGYGLRFIDTPTFRTMNFLHASAKQLRDISLSADHNMLAVASVETRTKLFDLRTRQVASVFTPSERTLWACAIDRNERENLLYLGAQHGSTYVYDMRFPETVVDEFKTEGDLSPVINIAPVPISKHFPNGGCVVCKMQSLWFYEYSAGSVTPYRLNTDGPFISMNYDVGQETLLVSARSNQRYPQSRYMLGKLEKIDEMPIFNVKVSFFGSKATPVMTRCSQIAVESNTLIAGYIQDVKLLALFDARREQRLQSLPVQEVVYDTCPVYVPNATYLAALTESKCRVYKLTSST